MAHRAVPDLFRLDGKVAVVTGASSGLGVAFAQGLAEAAPTSRSARDGSSSSPTPPCWSRPPDGGHSPWPRTSPPIRIARFPDGETSSVLAHLDIVDPTDPACDDPGPSDEIAVLDAMILRRQTNRRRFSDQHVPVEVLDAVRVAAECEGAVALEIHGEDHRLALARLSQRADAMQHGDPAYRAELRAWTTDDPERTDGVPAIAVPHVDAGSGDELPIRDFDTRGSGFLPTATASTRNQCLVLLGTESDHPMAWLRAGEALQRILLEITRLGLVASPLTQVVEVPSARAALRAELGLSMHPHVLLRIGYAPQTAGTPRRPIDAVLDRE